MNIATNIKVGEYEMNTPGLIACDHCGIVAVDTPAFGWKRWQENGELLHHCPAAVQYNEWVAGGLVHMKAPDEAVQYQYWPLPNVFYLVNAEMGFEAGPFVGHGEAMNALDLINGDLRSGTAVLSDGEYHASKIWHVNGR